MEKGEESLVKTVAKYALNVPKKISPMLAIAQILKKVESQKML